MSKTPTTIIPGSVDDTEIEHARLGPSGADGWCECALYPTMAELYPDDESTEAAELELLPIHCSR